MPRQPDFMRKLVVATHNAHKTGEIRQILADCFDVITDLTGTEIPPAVEDGATFEANAHIKALHASRYLPDALVLADDSGISVDALNGAPGIYSARYAGENATDEDNRLKLLRELGDAKNRAARFTCVLALARAGEIVHTCEGICEGQVIGENRGTGGFGYDPLFIPDGYDRTYAELPAEVKHSLSHRGRALAQMASRLSQRD